MQLRNGWLMSTVFAVFSCGNPAVDNQVDSLGPETAGVEQGPQHRPGQPCVLCHGGGGPGEPNFSIAGTVYRQIDDERPLQGVQVDLVDSHGRTRRTFTNCAGNFYLTESDWDPRFPVWVTLRHGDIVNEMETPIFRDGSCAACHEGDPSPTSVGRVFLSDEPFEGGRGGCR